MIPVAEGARGGDLRSGTAPLRDGRARPCAVSAPVGSRPQDDPEVPLRTCRLYAPPQGRRAFLARDPQNIFPDVRFAPCGGRAGLVNGPRGGRAPVATLTLGVSSRPGRAGRGMAWSGAGAGPAGAGAGAGVSGVWGLPAARRSGAGPRIRGTGTDTSQVGKQGWREWGRRRAGRPTRTGPGGRQCFQGGHPRLAPSVFRTGPGRIPFPPAPLVKEGGGRPRPA